MFVFNAKRLITRRAKNAASGLNRSDRYPPPPPELIRPDAECLIYHAPYVYFYTYRHSARLPRTRYTIYLYTYGSFAFAATVLMSLLTLALLCTRQCSSILTFYFDLLPSPVSASNRISAVSVSELVTRTHVHARARTVTHCTGTASPDVVACTRTAAAAAAAEPHETRFDWPFIVNWPPLIGFVFRSAEGENLLRDLEMLRDRAEYFARQSRPLNSLNGGGGGGGFGPTKRFDTLR